MKMLQHSIAVASFAALLAFGAPTQASWIVPDDEEPAEDEASEDADEEEEEDEYLAIVGGDVHTGIGSVLRGATILSKNGVIEEIGYDLYLPEGTEKVDARGMRVYPGMVAISATSRISRGLLGSADPQHTERELDAHYGVDDLRPGESLHSHSHGAPGPETEPESAPSAADAVAPEGTKVYDKKGGLQTSATESYDPFSQYLVLALATGITTAEQSGTAMKLRRDGIEGVGMNEDFWTSITWSTSNPATKRETRERFEQAAKYLRELRRWEALKDKEGHEEPSKRGVNSGVLSVLQGTTRARFIANDRTDLLGIARLAQEFDFRPVIFGCREGWTVADQLGRAGAYAVVTPRSRAEKDESLVRPGGSSIENAALLHAAGVQVAVIPSNTSFELSGMTGRDLMHLPIEAGFAVRGGLSNEAALEALTMVPARMMNVDHRVGSIEVGKDCDVIVTDGDLLHYETFVQYAVVAGKLAYDKQAELYYSHIRPRAELPPLEDDAEAIPEEGDEDEPAEGDEEGEGEEEEGDEGDGEGDGEGEGEGDGEGDGGDGEGGGDGR